MVGKRGGYLLGILLLLTVLVLLAGRLSELELEQGAILASDITPTPGSILDDALSGERTVLNIPLLDALSAYVKFVFWGLIPISFFVFLFAPGSRWRRLLVMLMTITGVFTAANMLRRFQIGLGSSPLGAMEPGSFDPRQGTPLVVPTSAEPSSTFTFLVSVLLAGIGLVLIWVVWRWLSRRQGSRTELAVEAEKALQDIRSGADLTETVRACYYRMTAVLEEEAGYERQRGMTPREFEASLQGTGVPVTHIRTLTRLFEQARYGGIQLADDKRQDAVASLRAISGALRERR